MAKVAVMHHHLGRYIPYTPAAQSGGVKAGDVVALVGRIGIATEDIAEGETGTLDLGGVYKLPAEAAAADKAWSQGDTLYWDATNKVLTKTSTGNTAAGFAWLDKATAIDVGYVKLSG
jgi:predicted RecA/RadA family phage recombinase